MMMTTFWKITPPSKQKLNTTAESTVWQADRPILTDQGMGGTYV
jgi:hypothetical protein